jgi:hypothetical protein
MSKTSFAFQVESKLRWFAVPRVSHTCADGIAWSEAARGADLGQYLWEPDAAPS